MKSDGTYPTTCRVPDAVSVIHIAGALSEATRSQPDPVAVARHNRALLVDRLPGLTPDARRRAVASIRNLEAAWGLEPVKLLPGRLAA